MIEEYLEILVEEPSMDSFLRVILPRILSQGYEVDQNCFIRPFEGKSDLMSSIPNKVNGYKNYVWPVKLLILHDQDSNDCVELKNEITNTILENNDQIEFKVRIVCRELESWYFGDMEAIEAVFPRTKASTLENKAKYRNPDNIFGAPEMERLIDGFKKSFASREIPHHMNIIRNRSTSFQHFVAAISELTKET